jgi:hypothetical protein
MSNISKPLAYTYLALSMSLVGAYVALSKPLASAWWPWQAGCGARQASRAYQAESAACCFWNPSSATFSLPSA